MAEEAVRTAITATCKLVEEEKRKQQALIAEMLTDVRHGASGDATAGASSALASNNEIGSECKAAENANQVNTDVGGRAPEKNATGRSLEADGNKEKDPGQLRREEERMLNAAGKSKDRTGAADKQRGTSSVVELGVENKKSTGLERHASSGTMSVETSKMHTGVVDKVELRDKHLIIHINAPAASGVDTSAGCTLNAEEGRKENSGKKRSFFAWLRDIYSHLRNGSRESFMTTRK